jgi:hypothetical protein
MSGRGKGKGRGKGASGGRGRKNPKKTPAPRDEEEREETPVRDPTLPADADADDDDASSVRDASAERDADDDDDDDDDDDADAGAEGKWWPTRRRVEEMIADFFEARPYFYSKGTEGYKNTKKKTHELSVLARDLNDIPSNNKGKPWDSKFLFSKFSKLFSQFLQFLQLIRQMSLKCKSVWKELICNFFCVFCVYS